MYPALKESVRLKPLAHACWVGDAYTNAEKELEPIGGFILSLCRGDLDTLTIARCVAAAYAAPLRDAEAQVQGTLANLTGFIDWLDAPHRIAQTYAMEDFFYITQPTEGVAWYSAPVYSMLVLTNRCNFRCAYCFNSSGPEREREMDESCWIEAARQIGEIGVPEVDVTGGEPLLMPFLPRLLDALHDVGTVPSVFTNGSLIDETWVKRFRVLNPIRAQVSLDAADADTHHQLTHSHDTFDHVTRAIAMLADAGVYVTCKALLTPKSYTRLGELVALCERLGARALTLDTYDLSVSGRGDRGFFLTQAQSTHAEQLVDEARARLRRDMPVSFVYGRKKWECAEQIVGCGALQNGFVLLANGMFTLCEKTAGIPTCGIGMFPQMSIAEMWEKTRGGGPLATPSDMYDEPCRSCKHFSTCRGGCPAMRALVTDRPYAADPRCWLAQYVNNPYDSR